MEGGTLIMSASVDALPFTGGAFDTPIEHQSYVAPS
jgi:hypothetical protein